MSTPTNVSTTPPPNPSTEASVDRPRTRRGWPHRRIMHTTVAAAVFVATVVAANWLTTRYGVIGVGLGLTATAGTFAAGATLLVRDWVHQVAGRVVVYACIAAGAALSVAPAGARLAAASVVAFVVAELVDLLVFSSYAAEAPCGRR